MEDLVVVNPTAYVKKKPYKYVPLTPPSELIESTTYTIDFTNRKFLNMGLNPENQLKTIIYIITSSGHVVIMSDF